MNEVTPLPTHGRPTTGTLLERAAARYALSPEGFRARTIPPVFPSENSRAPVVDRAPIDRLVVAIDRAGLRERGLIVPGAAVTPLAEEFRLVKRQLLQTARSVTDTDRARTILVCSARPDDGKTYCAINLALSLAAEKDVEVLLVDADFAKPDVLATLGVDASATGLLDALADPALDAEHCIVDTDIPRLALLPSGTRSHADTELLASDHAGTVLRRLATANPRRIVVYDSPPALSASPAATLAGNVGQVMLVVRADRTSEVDVRAAVALLDGCDHVQLLLNAVSFQPGGPRFGSYYGTEPQA